MRVKGSLVSMVALEVVKSKTVSLPKSLAFSSTSFWYAKLEQAWKKAHEGMETSVLSKTLTPLLQSAYRIKREQACGNSKVRTANITGESCVRIRTDCDSNENLFV